MNILLKIRLKKIYIFLSDRGDQMDPEIDQKGGPIKRCNSKVLAISSRRNARWHIKLTTVTHFWSLLDRFWAFACRVGEIGSRRPLLDRFWGLGPPSRRNIHFVETKRSVARQIDDSYTLLEPFGPLRQTLFSCSWTQHP